MNVNGTGVYLIHIEPAYKHAKHYLGWSPEIDARFNAHVAGKGARLTEVVTEAGCVLALVRVWEDAGRDLERRLKSWHKSPQLCPICTGQAGLQMPLLPGFPAYIPSSENLSIEEKSNEESTACH